MDIGNTLSSLNSARVVYTYGIYKREFTKSKKAIFLFNFTASITALTAATILSCREVRLPEYFACVQGTYFIYITALSFSSPVD